MTDAQAEEISAAVRAHLAATPAFDIGRPADFEALLQPLPPFPGLDPVEVRVVAAMCVLGPGSLLKQSGPFRGASSVPPERHRRKLVSVIRPHLPLRRVLEMEFAMAYGAGKWRAVPAASSDWDARWDGALGGLARAMKQPIHEVDAWLRYHVTRYVSVSQNPACRPHQSGAAQQRYLLPDRWRIAWALVQPERPLTLRRNERTVIDYDEDNLRIHAPGHEIFVPHGARAVWTIGARSASLHPAHGPPSEVPPKTRFVLYCSDEESRIWAYTQNAHRIGEWRLRIGESAALVAREPLTVRIFECTCGTAQCCDRHRLEGWDPQVASLWAFLASVIKGPHSKIRAGMFWRGMYGPLLSLAGWNACPLCQSRA